MRELRKEGKREVKEFKKERRPEFIHMDVKELPKIKGKKRYLFVTIDRTTRMVYIKFYDRKGEEETEDFVRKVVRFFPFKVRKVLTDNGKEFLSEAFGVYLESEGWSTGGRGRIVRGRMGWRRGG